MNIGQLINLGIYDDNEYVAIIDYVRGSKFAEKAYECRLGQLPKVFFDSDIEDVGALSDREKDLYNIRNKKAGCTGIFIYRDLDVDTFESCNRKRSKKKKTKESFDNADYLDNDNCLGYGIQIRNMNSGYIDLLCYNTKDLATQNLTIAELMENSDNYDSTYYEEDFDTIYGTTDNLFQEIDYRRDLDNGKIYGKERVLVYGNDDGFYVVINKIPVDLYF